MRLQKYMAECGVASRRKCEEIIAAGRVTVNGKVVDVMGAQVEAGDEVCVDGAPIRAEQRRQYILLNKLQGVVTTLSDPQGRRTVRDLIDGIPERIYPVGRLDYDTEGLLLLTNDGALMQAITHPRGEVEKLYFARVHGELTEQALGRLAQQSRRVDAYLVRRAQSLLQSAEAENNAWQLAVLQKADPVELEWALHTLAAHQRDPDQKTVQRLWQLVQQGSGSVQLTEKAVFTAKNGCLRLQVSAPPPAPPLPSQPLLPGEYSLPGGYELCIQVIPVENLKNTANIHKKDLNWLADYDKILSGTLLRTRKPGDSFCPARRGQTKSLKKLYNELGLSAQQRCQLPLLAAQNTVLWLWGQGFAAGLLHTEETKRILLLTECHNKGEHYESNG